MRLRVKTDPDVDPWFLPGTVAEIVADCSPVGVLADGWRRSASADEGHPVGTVYRDEELCPWTEFDLLP